ncbi:MAG: hypothetical protein PS018_20575, partial [bacterium]|nr:hypothetical protein [bacterium]
EWVKAATIRAAETVLREEVGKGFDNRPVVVTDGVPQRDYNAVKPFGKIEFISRPKMAEAVLWALDMLRKRSPVVSGRYVQSHVVLVNGAEVQGDVRVALLSVKEDARVQIVNTQPYARKLEGATARKATKRSHGRQKRAGASAQARSGIYQPVLRALVQRYGRSMFFDYRLVKINAGVKVWGAQGGSGKRVQRDQVYPSLQFYIKPGVGNGG